MNTQSSSKKSVISIIVIIAIAVVAYFLYSGSKTPDSVGTLTQSQANPEAGAVSARILNLLNQIRSLKIDTSIFRDNAYQTLVDYSVAIPPVNVGRPNPFAPLPGQNSAAGASAGTQQ